MSAPLVSLNGIQKTFANGTRALDHLELAIMRGEFVSLLGPSGCGKSTALRIIAGLEQADAGTLTFDGGRPEIAFVFQDATLMPWANVFDNVFLPLRLKGLSRQDANASVMDALVHVGLADFVTSYPRELSGGMKMRVSIARALVTKPTLLLMDEPFAALDEITRHRLNRDLLTLQADLDMSVIFVTHSVYESAFLSSRIAIFSPRPGRIVETITVAPTGARTEEFRRTPTYLEACGKAAHALELAMVGA